MLNELGQKGIAVMNEVSIPKKINPDIIFIDSSNIIVAIVIAIIDFIIVWFF